MPFTEKNMKIALIGYGKMGHEIEKVALERGHDIVCTIDLQEEAKFESAAFKSADVAIEFTVPSSAYHNYQRAFAAHVPVVSGTTGWLERLGAVKQACETEGQTFFYASNFSLGVNIFFALNRYLATLMNRFSGYDVRIEETHHIHKLDAPSGTAITLADDIIDQMERKTGWLPVDKTTVQAKHTGQTKQNDQDDPKEIDRNNPKEADRYNPEQTDPSDQNRPEKATTDSEHATASGVSTEGLLSIRSFREGEHPGIHTVIYESAADTIRLTHDAKNRKGFALGAVLAAEFIRGKKGFFGMEDMLKALLPISPNP